MSVWANHWRLGGKPAPKLHLPGARPSPKQGGSVRHASPKSPQAVAPRELCSLSRSWDTAQGNPVLYCCQQSGSREDVNDEIRGMAPEELEEIEWEYNLFKNTEHTKYCGTRSSGEKRFGKKAEGVSVLQTQHWQPYRAEIPTAICGLLNHS